MWLRLLGIALIILVIFAIVGYISNSKQFGNKIWSNKLIMYIVVLILGIFLAIF